jgi:hypothetical protein
MSIRGVDPLAKQITARQWARERQIEALLSEQMPNPAVHRRGRLRISTRPQV